MDYLDLFRSNPVLVFMGLLVLLITVVPVGAALYRKQRRKAHPFADNPDERKAPDPARFLGTQMDIALLIFGALLLLAAIARLWR